MKNCAEYIASAKAALGDSRMSDRALGEHLGFAQQTISKAKNGRMSDEVALALGELLVKHKLLRHVGEVVLVAHAESDADPRVRSALMAYAGKVVGQVVAVFAGLALTLSLLLPQPALALEIGGDEGK